MVRDQEGRVADLQGTFTRRTECSAWTSLPLTTALIKLSLQDQNGSSPLILKSFYSAKTVERFFQWNDKFLFIHKLPRGKLEPTGKCPDVSVRFLSGGRHFHLTTAFLKFVSGITWKETHYCSLFHFLLVFIHCNYRNNIKIKKSCDTNGL